MAWPYKIRSADWNYGGSKWKLSRSKIELFMKCPRCFYLDNKLGLKRPDSFPLNLNTAVDTLLKKEFDLHRAQGTPHPLMDAYGVDATPYAHKDLNEWRENFVGVQHFHEPIGVTVSGAVDDIWVNPKGELIVVDYKATSKDGTITIDDEWKVQYKRQMEIYQWLLRRKGFTVSNTGYFVYANGLADKEAFDGKLEFDVTLLPHEGNDGWVDGVLVDIKKCLESETIPPETASCDHCSYVRETAKFLAVPKKAPAKRTAPGKKDEKEQPGLF